MRIGKDATVLSNFESGDASPCLLTHAAGTDLIFDLNRVLGEWWRMAINVKGTFTCGTFTQPRRYQVI